MTHSLNGTAIALSNLMLRNFKKTKWPQRIFLLVGLAILGLVFSKVHWTQLRPNPTELKSVQSFEAAMRSWNEVHRTTQNTERTRALLEKTISKLQDCDRQELEKLYPGWGAQRDLFLSAAFGYLQGLDRQELRERDTRESNAKLRNFLSWMDQNWESLQSRIPQKMGKIESFTL